jgi:hypothetical protein
MTARHRDTGNRHWAAPALLAAAFVMLTSSLAGAADRVVLGEYFTNLY